MTETQRLLKTTHGNGTHGSTSHYFFIRQPLCLSSKHKDYFVVCGASASGSGSGANNTRDQFAYGVDRLYPIPVATCFVVLNLFLHPSCKCYRHGVTSGIMFKCIFQGVVY